MTIALLFEIADALFAILLFLVPLVIIRDNIRKSSRAHTTSLLEPAKAPVGRVMHYQTAEPIAGAQIMVYRSDGKMLTTLTANMQGEFASAFPAGEYGFTVSAPGYELASSTSPEINEIGTVYVGGMFKVEQSDTPSNLIIPVAPLNSQPITMRVRLQILWHATLFAYRKIFWVIWSLGIASNSLLLVLAPSVVTAVAELLYVCTVAAHLFLQSQTNITRAQEYSVRDKETGEGLDLAVIRLVDEETGRLIATKISDTAGKFSLVPSPGVYRLEVERDGYAPVSRTRLVVTAQDNSALEAPIDMEKTGVI